MNTLIVFMEGLSGNFLKILLTEQLDQVGFRIDTPVPSVCTMQERQLLYKKQLLVGDLPPVACIHEADTALASRFDVVLKIIVRKKIYQAIYNVFHKKTLVEESGPSPFSEWQLHRGYWYDKTYYLIADYYKLFSQDWANNTWPCVVNFDHITDHDYLSEVLSTYFNKSLTDKQHRIISQYGEKQLQLPLHVAATTMDDIVRPIPPDLFHRDPWFASYCLHRFEQTHGWSEQHRNFSIDSLPRVITAELLVKLQHLYH